MTSQYDEWVESVTLCCFLLQCSLASSTGGPHKRCLSAVRSLLEEGGSDSSIAYLDRLRDGTDCMRKPIAQGHPILDLFMTHLLQTSSMKDHGSRLITGSRSSHCLLNCMLRLLASRRSISASFYGAIIAGDRHGGLLAAVKSMPERAARRICNCMLIPIARGSPDFPFFMMHLLQTKSMTSVWQPPITT